MHEMSLAGGVLQVVEDAARREGFAQVKRLVVAVGALSGVEVRALRFALESLAPGTCLDGATVQIDEPAAEAWCLGCGQRVAIRQRLDDCPACGSARLQPLGGTEVQVVELVVADGAAAPESDPAQTAA